MLAAPATAAVQATRPAARPAGPAALSFGARLEAAAQVAAPRPAPLAAAVRAVEAAQARLDGVLAAARSGRTFSGAELLALQAEAYRFTQTLDVAGKLVEQGVQGVKQAIHTPL